MQNFYNDRIESFLSCENDYEFLYQAYQNILHRAPDGAGREFYAMRLKNNGNRIKVLFDLCTSKEGCIQDDHHEWLGVIEHRLDMISKFKNLIRGKKRSSVATRLADNGQGLVSLESAEPKQFFKVKRDDGLYVANLKAVNQNRRPTIWVDLTTVMEWTGGVVGIVRAELEIAKGLARIDPNIRFSMQFESGFVEIPKEDLSWLLSSDNVVEAYLRFFDRLSDKKKASSSLPLHSPINILTPQKNDLFFPYIPGDAVIAVGWKDSQKEKYFSKVKVACPDIYLSYLVYDTILVNPTTSIFYPPESQAQFMAYFRWITDNCDFIFCGGKNTQKDCKELQESKGWRVTPSFPVRFGTDITTKLDFDKPEDEVLRDLGVVSSFIMTVGTIEPRKNHSTLIRAYLMTVAEMGNAAPLLVIVGKQGGLVGDMINQVKRHPQLKGRVLIISPTDSELALLYKRCLFTVLPSLYEGWSLTLPESLGQGKLCLSADVPPLREIANEIVDFIDPFDSRKWAEKIMFYSKNQGALIAANNKVKALWKNDSWQECAQQIHAGLQGYIGKNEPIKASPEVWFDLTTSFLYVPGVMSGIIRVELSYAKYLNEIYPNVHYFAYSHNELFEIDKSRLSWLFEGDDIASAYKFFYEFWHEYEKKGEAFRSPFVNSDVPASESPSRLKLLGDDSIVFLVNIDWDLHWTKAIVNLAAKSKNVVVAQFIHDVTPIVVPHLHQEVTCEKFEPFFNFCSNHINYLQYGGNTAQIDGVSVQQQRGWKSPPSDFIKLASDFTKTESNDYSDQFCLDSLNVHGDFIITVGTVEPRKNHEVLYKAYLKLIDEGKSNLPLMLFVGKPGWNSSDFLSILSADKRISHLIRIVTPNDQQLDVLYRKCKFAVLPSFYEGYSLTLNECLSYGKFCITSDTPPLREVGGDLVDYIDPLDIYAWGDAIYGYHTDNEQLHARTQKIIDSWKLITWKDSALSLLNSAQKAQSIIFPEFGGQAK